MNLAVKFSEETEGSSVYECNRPQPISLNSFPKKCQLYASKINWTCGIVAVNVNCGLLLQSLLKAISFTVSLRQ